VAVNINFTPATYKIQLFFSMPLHKGSVKAR
jgi:hypothetical protein